MEECSICGYSTFHQGWCSLHTEGKKKTMARKTYILIKDAPDVYKGAIFQEACDNGDQEFICLTLDFIKPGVRDDDNISFDRKIVMKQPEFFMPYTEWVENLPRGVNEDTATEVLRQHAKNSKKETISLSKLSGLPSTGKGKIISGSKLFEKVKVKAK